MPQVHFHTLILKLTWYLTYMFACRCSDEKNPRAKPYTFSNQKLKDLGLKFTPVEQSIYDTVKCLQEKGHISVPKKQEDSSPKVVS